MTSSRRLVDLSHTVSDGLVTYPGLPAPRIRPHLTREASRASYAPGTEFALDVIEMIGNTGTYLDSPFHRYDGGTDLAGLDLATLVDLPALVVTARGERAVGPEAFAGLDVRGAAVLLATGWDVHFATAEYARDAPFLTEDAPERSWRAERCSSASTR
ncbi:cyclase family protein [Rathayibacter sp. VKM Ac-2630]|uniref:cyclase family protein n=1 Tax=Rathayibacter sp. VKM Ac-2630 TaxID=1938617 RepID=UPI001F2DB70E|nr:cyclase family protein [Rathayibacter sp. VKM Ac-2630]